MESHALTSTVSPLSTACSTNSIGVRFLLDDQKLTYQQQSRYEHGQHSIFSPHKLTASRSVPSQHQQQYAEITTVDRTMKESALQKIQGEMEQQLARLKSLNTKDFCDEMAIIQENLNLSDEQMTNIAMLSLHNVPMAYRFCFYIHIRQKHNTRVYLGSFNDTMTRTHTDISEDVEMELSDRSDSDSIHSAEENKLAYHPKIESLFALIGTPQTIPRKRTDQESILESKSMEYKLDDSLQPQPQPNDEEFGLSSKLHIDTLGADRKRREPFWKIVARILRCLLLFVIPFLYTALSSCVAVVIACDIWRKYTLDPHRSFDFTEYGVFNMFLSANSVDAYANDFNADPHKPQSILLVVILSLRISTLLCWYILFIHALLFRETQWCCCCCRDRCCHFCDESSAIGKRSLLGLERSTRKIKRNKMQVESRMSTVLLNTSISIEEHLRMEMRSIHSMNMIKFSVRQVMVPNVVATILQLFLFNTHSPVALDIASNDSSWQTVNIYVQSAVLFGFYWSLSDWFYYERDIVLVSRLDIFHVFCIDLCSNWIKFLYEILRFVLFLALCILAFVPLTVFVWLRLVLCRCWFGYNNDGCLLCNLFEHSIEILLSMLQKCYT